MGGVGLYAEDHVASLVHELCVGVFLREACEVHCFCVGAFGGIGHLTLDVEEC